MGTPEYIKRAKNKYNSKFYLVQVRLPRETRERIQSALKDGESINSYCADAVLEKLEGKTEQNQYAAYDEQKSHASLQALIDAKRKEYEENKEKVDPEEIRRLTIARASDINEGLGERKKKTEDEDF